MSNNTCFSYGTKDIVLKKTNNLILENFVNDISELDVSYININNSDEEHEYEKKFGEIFKNKTKLRNSFKYIVKLNVDCYTEKDIVTFVKRSCSTLRIDKVDILNIDINDCNIDFNNLFKALVKLKNEGLVLSFCLSNFNYDFLDSFINIFKENKIDIDYVIFDLPIKEYRNFINKYYSVIKLYNVTIIFDNIISNDELKKFPLVEKFIKETGYSSSEFSLLFLNALIEDKIVNISTNNMKQFKEFMKLKNNKLEKQQFDKFMSIIKGVK